MDLPSEIQLVFMRPGGWVLVEDVDFGGPMAAARARSTSAADHRPLIERLSRAGDAVLGLAGADASFDSRLRDLLHAAGLDEIGGGLHSVIASGGAERWTPNTVEHLQEHILRSRIMTADDIASFLTMSSSAHNATAGMASIWGRRRPR